MMHPGWKVFFQGWISGMFMIGTMVWLARADWVGSAVCGTIFILTFASGGRNAEGLTERRASSVSRPPRGTP